MTDEYTEALNLTIERMKAENQRLAKRLNYAELQMLREAKFKNRNRPEDQRFFRALDVVTEVKNDLAPNPYI